MKKHVPWLHLRPSDSEAWERGASNTYSNQLSMLLKQKCEIQWMEDEKGFYVFFFFFMKKQDESETQLNLWIRTKKN